MVSLGDEDPYQTHSLSDEEALYEQFRSEDCAYGADMLKYEKGFIFDTLTKNHTVKTMEQTVTVADHFYNVPVQMNRVTV